MRNPGRTIAEPAGGGAGRKVRRRLHAAAWILLVLLAVACYPLGSSFLETQRLAGCREPVDGPEASRRIAAFFGRYHSALEEGALDLEPADPSLLPGNLRLLARILGDDSLLEAELHRRSAPRRGERRMQSAHQWLAGESGAAIRSRLVDLTSHPLASVRSQASSALAALALKMPEALASEPLLVYRREHLRALLLVQGGERVSGPVSLRPFLREVLRAPSGLRLWAAGRPPGPGQAQPLALRALLALDEIVAGDLAQAVISSSPLRGPDLALEAQLLARVAHPEAWTRLLAIAGGGEGLAQRLCALGSLEEAAPLEAAPRILELGRMGEGGWSERVARTLDHLRGGSRSPPEGKGEPGRLASLRSVHPAGAAAARAIAALRFLALHPAGCLLDPETRSLVVRLLGSSIPEVRREAARAVGRIGLVEGARSRPAGSGARSGGAAAPPSNGGSTGQVDRDRDLLELLADPDFGVAETAARALFDLTGFWPAQGGLGDGPGSLSLETAADPGRLSSWMRAWEEWLSGRKGSGRADWLLEGLSSGEPGRTAGAARSLLGLALAGTLPSGWRQAHQAVLHAAILHGPSEAKAELLSLLAETGDPGEAEPVWSLLEPACRADPVDGWEVVRAAHRLLERAAPVRGAEFPVDWLLRKLSGLEGGSAGIVARYLDSRFPPALLDERLLVAIRALARRTAGSGGAAGEPVDDLRAALVRWFPRAPTPELARVLVELLSDPALKVRFWAAAHLKELAGNGLGYDPAAPLPDREPALARWRSWSLSWQPRAAR